MIGILSVIVILSASIVVMAVAALWCVLLALIYAFGVREGSALFAGIVLQLLASAVPPVVPPHVTPARRWSRPSPEREEDSPL